MGRTLKPDDTIEFAYRTVKLIYGFYLANEKTILVFKSLLPFIIIIKMMVAKYICIVYFCTLYFHLFPR